MEPQERPTAYDMYDIDCWDYGPYTPTETSLKSSSKAEEMDPGSSNSESVLSSRHSSPHTGSLSGSGSDYLVVDECLASDQEMTSLEEPPPLASRPVIDEGIYGRLAVVIVPGLRIPASPQLQLEMKPDRRNRNQQHVLVLRQSTSFQTC
jgi:hypothetical protein